MGINISESLFFLVGLFVLTLKQTSAAPVAMELQTHELLLTEGCRVWGMCTGFLQHLFQGLQTSACALTLILVLASPIPAPSKVVEKRLERSTIAALNTLDAGECAVLYILAFVWLWSTSHVLAFGILCRYLFQAAIEQQDAFQHAQKLTQRLTEQTPCRSEQMSCRSEQTPCPEPSPEQSKPASNEGTVIPLSNQPSELQGHENTQVFFDVDNDDSGYESDSSAAAESDPQTDFNIEELTWRFAALPTQAYSAWDREISHLAELFSRLRCSDSEEDTKALPWNAACNRPKPSGRGRSPSGIESRYRPVALMAFPFWTHTKVESSTSSINIYKSTLSFPDTEWSRPELKTQTLTSSDNPNSQQSNPASQTLENKTSISKDKGKHVERDSLVEALREQNRKLEAEADAAKEEARTARKETVAAQEEAADARKAACDLQQKLNVPCSKCASVQQTPEQTTPSGTPNLQEPKVPPAVSAPSPPAVCSMTSTATQTEGAESTSLVLEPQTTSLPLAAPCIASSSKEGASHPAGTPHDIVTESSTPRPTATSNMSRKRDAISLKRTGSGVKKHSSPPRVSNLGLRVAAVCGDLTTRSQSIVETKDVEMTDASLPGLMQHNAGTLARGRDSAAAPVQEQSEDSEMEVTDRAPDTSTTQRPEQLDVVMNEDAAVDSTFNNAVQAQRVPVPEQSDDGSKSTFLTGLPFGKGRPP